MSRPRRSTRRPLVLGLAGVLGVGAAVLVACGTTNSKLIPGQSAGQLTTDFDAVGAASSSGNCQETYSAIGRTRTDLAALPATLDPHLAAALKSGVDTLSRQAQLQCKQQATTTTPTNTNATPSTSTTPTNTNTGPTTATDTLPTDTTSTPTDTTSTATTPTDTTPSTGTTTGIFPGNGGGTPAPNGQSGQGNQGGGGSGVAGGTFGGGSGN